MTPSDPLHRRLRIVLVDDHEDVRTLVRLRLALDGRIEVVGEAADGVTAIALVTAKQPDAVVLDLALPGLDGLRAIPALRRTAPGTRIVVLSAFPDPYTLVDVLAQGADSYLDKAAALDELAPTLVSVCCTGAANGY